jgi:hypothetical protein
MKWEIDSNFCHSAVDTHEKEADIKLAVLEASEYAFALLGDNIEDDSMYCVFDWDFPAQQLAIVVTDPSKLQQAKHKVVLTLKGYATHISGQKDQQEQIHLWIHNHITTSESFFRYSLVAVITENGDMNNSTLL